MNRNMKSLTAIALLGLLVLACVATPVAAASHVSKGRWLKIRVYEKGATTPNVLVNLPMSVVSAFLRIAAKAETRASVDLGGETAGKTRVRVDDLDLAEAIRELESMEPGQIMEVQDGEQRVSIWIE